MSQDYFNSLPDGAAFYTGLFLFGTALYGMYYRKFREYLYLQDDDIPDSKANVPRGKCPPFFPNGWFSIINSAELKVNDVQYIDYCGRNIVLFRGANGKAYALHSYCSHMGANLGLGGTVKGDSTIQCPFHGWTFDGENGDCVQAFQNIKKKVDQYNYHDIKEQIKVDGEYLYNCYEGNIKLKKYHVREKNGSILIWFDSREEFQDNIPYEPLDMDFTGVEFRGESINFVNSHCQEIPENGADTRHFDFLHTDPVDCIPFIKFEWLMKSHRADDPVLWDVMVHKDPFLNKVKQEILKKQITETNKKFLNVIYLDCFLKIFGFKFHTFNITGFQCGPGLVYLVLQFYFMRAIFCQSVTPLKKFKIKVSHKIWTSHMVPYGASAYMLYGEVKQLYNDMKIWNNKIFGSRLSYNLKTEGDRNLLSWRNWFGQFYEGCEKYEKEMNKLDW